MLSGSDAAQPKPYHGIGLPYLDSVEGFRRGAAAHRAEINADLPNHATLRGTVLTGEVDSD